MCDYTHIYRTQVHYSVYSSLLQYIILHEHTHVHIKGYLKPCREYSQLFDKEKVEVIFSNVEQIYLFQRDFLRELETRVITDHMADSQIGEVFVLNVSIVCENFHCKNGCMFKKLHIVSRNNKIFVYTLTYMYTYRNMNSTSTHSIVTITLMR